MRRNSLPSPPVFLQCLLLAKYAGSQLTWKPGNQPAGSPPVIQTREGKERNGMEDKWHRPRTDTEALRGFNRQKRRGRDMAERQGQQDL